MKEVDVAEDFTIDQSLLEACSDSVLKYCGDIPHGDARSVALNIYTKVKSARHIGPNKYY